MQLIVEIAQATALPRTQKDVRCSSTEQPAQDRREQIVRQHYAANEAQCNRGQPQSQILGRRRLQIRLPQQPRQALTG